MDDIATDIQLEKASFSLWHSISIAKSFLIRGGIPNLLSPLSAGTLSGLNVLPVLCATSLFQFICASVLLCPEDSVFLKSYMASGSYNLSATSAEVPEPRDKEFGEALSFWTECSIDGVSQASETY